MHSESNPMRRNVPTEGYLYGVPLGAHVRARVVIDEERSGDQRSDSRHFSVPDWYTEGTQHPVLERMLVTKIIEALNSNQEKIPTFSKQRVTGLIFKKPIAGGILPALLADDRLSPEIDPTVYEKLSDCLASAFADSVVRGTSLSMKQWGTRTVRSRAESLSNPVEPPPTSEPLIEAGAAWAVSKGTDFLLDRKVVKYTNVTGVRHIRDRVQPEQPVSAIMTPRKDGRSIRIASEVPLPRILYPGETRMITDYYDGRAKMEDPTLAW